MASHSIWTSSGLDKARFQAYVKLLRLRNGGQVAEAEPFIPDVSDLETSQYTAAEDTDSTVQAPLAYIDEDRLKREFLDRVAELVADVRGSRHVSASVLVESPDGIEVLVSKNSGIAEGSADWQLLKSLELNLKRLANSKEFVDSTERLDSPLWELLLNAYESRIADYIHSTKQILWKITLDPGRSTSSPTLETQLLDLSSLLKQKERSPGHSCYAEAVSLSHKICRLYNQADFDSLISNEKSSRSLRDSLGYLGRLRSCLRIFTLAVTRLEGFNRIIMIPLMLDKETKSMSHLETWPLKRAFAGLGLELNDDNVSALMKSAPGKSIWTKQRLLSRFEDLKKTRNQVHAEVQIILTLTKRTNSTGTVFKYVGCSKLSCFLCHRFVKHYGSFSTRGCHGKIYDLWTVPELQGTPKAQAANVASSLKKTEQEVRFSIQNPNDNIQHVKESVLGDSMVSGAVSKDFSDPYVASLAAQHIRSQRLSQTKVLIEPYEGQELPAETSDEEPAELDVPALREGPADEVESECDTCSAGAKRQCSFCGLDRYCCQTCQDRMSLHHLRKCSARSITTADILQEAAIHDEIPVDPETRQDYGFERCVTQQQQTYLFGLFQGLFTRLNVQSTEVDEWKQAGTLVPNIVAKFTDLPEYLSIGKYFPWFCRHQYLLDDSIPLPEAEAMESTNIIERSLESARDFLGEEDRVKHFQDLEPPAKRYCYIFFALALGGWSPNPAWDKLDLWYDFGFVVCRDERDEREFGRVYTDLLGGNNMHGEYDTSRGNWYGSYRRKPKPPICSFEQFWKAWQSRSLGELFERLGGLDERWPHLRGFLSCPTHTPRPSIWRLRHLLALGDTHSFEGFPEIVAAAREYGVSTAPDARIKLELLSFYRELSRKAVPLSIHEGRKSKGGLVELAKASGVQTTDGVLRVLRNLA